MGHIKNILKNREMASCYKNKKYILCRLYFWDKVLGGKKLFKWCAISVSKQKALHESSFVALHPQLWDQDCNSFFA